MTEDRHEIGIEVFKSLFGTALLEAGPLDEFSRVAIDMLFGEIYTRPGFALRDRSLVTVAALTALKSSSFTSAGRSTSLSRRSGCTR